MATITTYNAAKTQEIADGTVVDGIVDESGNLILERRDGTTFDAGDIVSPKGNTGTIRPLPAGQIVLYTGQFPPEGWLICAGAVLSRTAYPELFAAIGTSYGAGDGSTTFGIPDLRGRVAVGVDAAQTEFDTLNEKGGTRTHILTVNEMPAHTHTILGYSGTDDSNFSGNAGRLNASDGQVTQYDIPTASVGGNSGHNNLQPYVTVNYLISLGKTGNVQGGGSPIPRHFTTKRRGTTAQRNSFFGVPANHNEHVALSNQKATWYNTDLGWYERYYMMTGSLGLTVPGLVSTATQGWYPIGEGPYIQLEATAPLTVMLNSLIGNYGNMRRRGGASWFTSAATERIQVLKHGRYDVSAWTIQESGSFAGDYAVQILNSDGSTILKNIGGGKYDRLPGLLTKAHMGCEDLIIAPNSQVAFALLPGTLPGAISVHAGSNGARGIMSVKYVGPPLASE